MLVGKPVDRCTQLLPRVLDCVAKPIGWGQARLEEERFATAADCWSISPATREAA
jgi:hypothetical protein